MAEIVGGLAGSLQGTVTGLLNKGQSFIDQWFPPERRADLWARFQKFLNEKPMLASFLLSHIAISGLPLLLFIALTITVGVFSLLGGLLVGLLGALLFIVVAVGFALIILLPTLFFTTLVASFLWLWGLGTYYILKYFNKKEIPGIHTDLKLGGESENDKLDALNGRPNGTYAPPKLEKRSGGDAEKKMNGNVKSGQTSGVDIGNGWGEIQKRADLSNVTNRIGDVREQADGVTKNLPVNGATKKLPMDGVTGSLPTDGVTKNLPLGGL